MVTSSNENRLVHFLNFILISLSAFFLSCSHDKVSLPAVMEFVPPVENIGAIAWINDSLVVQELGTNRYVLLVFDEKRGRLRRKSHTKPQCMSGLIGLKPDMGECEPARSLLVDGNKLLALGPNAIMSVDTTYPGSLASTSYKSIPKSISATFVDGRLFFLKDAKIIELKEDGSISEQIAPNLPPTTGLVYHNKAFYTATLADGKILKIEQKNGKMVTTAISTPIAPMPYGLAFDREKGVFWLTSISTNRIYRVSEKVFEEVSMHELKKSPQEIKGDTKWSGSLVKIDSLVKVPAGASLTVNAGSRIEFVPGAGLLVEGKLFLKGSPEFPVALTAIDNSSWEGIQAVSGAEIVVECSEITSARNGIIATDPSVIQITNSRFDSLFSDGLSVKVESAFPRKFEVRGNSFSNIGESAVSVSVKDVFTSTSIHIFENSFYSVGYGVKISSSFSRAPEERLGEISRPFQTNELLDVVIEKNGFYKNLFDSVYINGDALSIPLSLRMTANSLVFGSLLGDGVVIEEVGKGEFIGNIFADLRCGIRVINASVNLRQNFRDKLIHFSANLFKNNIVAILGLTRQQTSLFDRNSFIAKYQVTVTVHDLQRRLKLSDEDISQLTFSKNYWEPAVPEWLVSPLPVVFSMKVVSKGESDFPLNLALLECFVVKGVKESIGTGLKVEIRSLSGKVVAEGITNAAGRVIFMLSPAEYFARVEGSLKWSKVKVSALKLNSCSLRAP